MASTSKSSGAPDLGKEAPVAKKPKMDEGDDVEKGGGGSDDERFSVVYLIKAESEADTRKIASDLCLEQTVELPGSVQPVVDVHDYVVGRIEKVIDINADGGINKKEGETGEKCKRIFRVTVAFPNDTAGGELTQFLNVVFGNTSLKPDVAVENVELSPTLLADTTIFPGPRFGIEGLRRLVGVTDTAKPLLMTALKPMGYSSAQFATMAYQLAKGGIDLIKDDHGLANQSWSPFEERVKMCCDAVAKANAETGKKCVYVACLNAPASKILERAKFAKDSGAGAVMVLPGISGFDVVRELACDSDFNLPIIVHPALLGGWIQANHLEEESIGGLSHEFLFGVLPRLCGGDASIFPNSGGRFSFSKSECLSVVNGCRCSDIAGGGSNRFAPIFPSPGGGMKLHRIQEMRDQFGNDTLFLIGGALFEEGSDLEISARAFCKSAGRD